VDLVDDTAALAIEEMLAKAAAAGKRFIVCGASAQVMAMFKRLGMQAQMAIAPDVSRQQALEAVLA
jgi:anti-anti-sigma regulatory factor